MTHGIASIRRIEDYRVFDEIVDPHDVLVGKGEAAVRLAFQVADRLGIVPHPVWQKLQRHIALQLLVSRQPDALATECPHTKANWCGCLLHELRKMEPRQIINWLDRLDGEEREFLMLYHKCCLVTQWENGRPPETGTGAGLRAEAAASAAGGL